MRQQQTWMVVGGALLALVAGGCATVQKGGTLASNPIVLGGLSVASQQQCQQYAVDHPADAAALRDYLVATQAAVSGCVDGIAAGLAP